MGESLAKELMSCGPDTQSRSYAITPSGNGQLRLRKRLLEKVVVIRLTFALVESFHQTFWLVEKS